jgi:hypothetical protein
VDAMGVDELGVYRRAHWPRIKEALLKGEYRPQPVRRVEIPKPGARKDKRKLGIPCVLDRLSGRRCCKSYRADGMGPSLSTVMGSDRVVRPIRRLLGFKVSGRAGASWWMWTWRRSSTGSTTIV